MKLGLHRTIIAILIIFIQANVLFAQVPNYVPTNGLIGYWPFNGNANDISGNGYNLVNNNVTFGNDRNNVANAAAYFSGNSSQLTSQTAVSQFTSSPLQTYSFWFKNVSSNWRFIVNYANSATTRLSICPNTLAATKSIAVIGSNGCLNCGASGGGYDFNSPGLEIGWHHIAVSVSASTYSVFYDGNLLSTQPHTGFNCVDASFRLVFGNDIVCAPEFYEMFLDDIGIWNRALTPAEITSIYNTTPIGPTLSIAATPSTPACAGSPVTLTASTTSGASACQASALPSNLQTGLVGYWPFCGNANDASGNNNNGTVNGATLTTDRFGNANNAYSFDGGDYITANSIASTNLSVSVWYNSNANSIYNPTTGHPPIGSQLIGQGTQLSPTAYCDYALGLTTYNGSQQIALEQGLPPSTYFQMYYGNTTFNHANWENMTLTVQGSTAKIYKNGILLSTFTFTGSLQNVGSILAFGARQIGNSGNPLCNFYTGLLDDISIWNRALTAAEVQQVYNLNSGATYSWSPGGATTQSITVSPTTNTTYSCTVTANSASTTSTYTVNVLPAPSITATNNSVCAGNSTTLTATAGSSSAPNTCWNLTGSLATGLVGYWPFCGNANDVSGNNNNGTVNGATLTTDRFGNANSAYSFDGVSNFISANRIYQQSFSVSLWFTATGNQIYNPLIDGFDSNWEVQLKNYFPDFVNFLSLTSYQELMCSQIANTNIWTNLICVFDVNIVKFYINGQFINQVSANPLLNSAGLYYFGASLSGTAQYYSGKLDDIGIWNRALTTTEIQQLYTQGQTTYSWTPGGATTPSITVSPTSTTTYTCAVTNGNGTCSSDFVVTVNPLPSTTVTTNGATSFCPGSSVQLCAPTGTGNTYLWSGNLATTSCITVSSSQTTSVTVTTPAGCSATSAPQQVVVFGNPVANAGPDVTMTCVQNASGVQIGAAPNAAYTYSWSPSTGLSATNIANPIANPTVTTTYTLTVVNADGCMGSDQVVVTVNKTPPTANAGLDFTKTCVSNPTGATIGTTAIAGNTYAWTPTTGLSSATISNPLANPTATTNYTLMATNTANGCTATDQVLVTVNTQIPTVAPISGSNTVCEGATLNLTNTTSGGTWSSSNTNIATVNNSGVVSGILAGSVNITYTFTDANGCSNSAVKSITVNPTPNATITVTGSLNICPGQTVTLCAPSGTGYSYLWCNATITSCITTSFAGTYCLIVTNSFGCSSSNNQITVNVLPTPTSNAGPDVTKNCIQNPTGAVIGTAAVAGNTYSWTPTTGLSSATAAQPTANPLVSTTYSVTTTNSAGCTATDQVLVTVNTFQPTANAGLDFTKTCISNVNGLTIGSTSVTGNTYAWTPTTGLSSATVSNPTANPTTTTTYTLTTTNTASGCTATDQVLVTVDNQGPTVNAGIDLSKTCVSNVNGATIGMTAIAGNSYTWTPASGLSSTTIANPFANPTVTTTYTVSSTNPTTGCTATDQIVVTVNNTPPTANAGLDATVSCNTNVGGALLGTPTVAGNSYSWTPSTGLNSSTLSQPTANPSTNTTYNLMVMNASSGCMSTDQVDVSVNTTPATANAGPDGSVNCLNNGTGYGLGSTPIAGMTYSWTPSTGLSSATVANPLASPTVATVYTLTATNAASGCTATDQVTVFINTQVPSVDAGLNQIICAGTTVTLSGNGSAGATFQWNNGIQNGVAFVPTTTTTYTLTATAANGCSSTDQVIVAVNSLPVVSAGPDINACDGSAVTLSGSGALSYTWQPAVQNGQAFIPVNSSAFIVTGTDANNCQQTDTVQVNVVQSTSSTLNESACDAYALNGQTYTQSGTYTQVISNGSGCDSTITLNLNMDFSPITPVITLTNGVTMTTPAQANVSFQWINCSDLTPIAGATGTTFTASMNGVYAVVASNACGSDTSECGTINSVGISDLSGTEITVFPNPTDGALNVKVSTSMLGQTWKLYDIRGRLVVDGNIETESTTLSMEQLSRGTYWLKLGSMQPVQVVKN
jgi:hypothetical protein